MKKLMSAVASICLLTLGLAFYTNQAQAASYDKATAAKTLTVKASPSQKSKTLGKISVGKSVQVYGGVPIGTDQYNWPDYKTYGYSKIKYGKTYGYVPASQLSFSSPFNWAPGVESLVIKSFYTNHYATKKDTFKFVKYSVVNSEGLYSAYIKHNGTGSWEPFVSIDCKTGWYHG
jgi:hypothetical protein